MSHATSPGGIHRGCVIVAAAVVIGLMPVLSTGCAAAFPDTTDHPYRVAIDYVQARGIVSGYPDGLYRPDHAINRAEFTKILIGGKVTERQLKECVAVMPSPFPDVVAGDWFAPYVCAAKHGGIIAGYPDGTFRPGGMVNFAEAAKIVVGAYGLPRPDVPGAWYVPYVAAMRAAGAIPPSIAQPDQKVTRGEMAVMIHALETGTGDGEGPEPTEPEEGGTSASFSWDFRHGIEGSEWNVRLIPLPSGTPHPGRDLRLPPEEHMDYYLEHAPAVALTADGLRFTVRPGDAVVAGDKQRVKERAEIGRFGKGQGEKGQTNTYSMRFKLEPGGTIPSGKDFAFITQSHAQVDVDFPGGWTMFVGVTGEDELTFVYGLNDGKTHLQKHAFPAEFGTWHDLTVQVHWSDGSDGWGEVFLDGSQAVPRVAGPNMPTNDAMEWKVGIYRGQNLQGIDILNVQSVEHATVETSP